MAPPRTVQLTDPAAMRVLAHPTRLRLLAELRTSGPASVGALARVVDEAPGSVSYHLGRLAEVGFVEEAAEHARDRRERWWRATAELTHLDPAADRADPERTAASTALRQQIARSLAQEVQAYLAAEHALPAQWVDAGTQGDWMWHLTAAELAEFTAQLEALCTAWQQRSDPHREDARPVRAICSVFPHPPAP
ncbi:helix-turn-helix domain-containing protein [Paenibacillus sp. TRM 82003]|uniref:winged helix-turn-helix domain-containing protein n=1 Tax=Kineococcus sp. TRM81007 TaxID=2925831 RepID=UPI001F564AED|nr:helix-turn-helix domain-containing protein [Kineococcus sp. TRM81007]MCI2239365.1 helix-turn-helix domain-containing protein [Kineococcus sp. TRM81007]MCI3925047.1 helix-turn-helix domain-containing protein [Paenibacillus sp. TRM 82003]